MSCESRRKPGEGRIAGEGLVREAADAPQTPSLTKAAAMLLEWYPLLTQ